MQNPSPFPALLNVMPNFLKVKIPKIRKPAVLLFSGIMAMHQTSFTQLQFNSPVVYADNLNPIDVSIADFNGDGKPDVATINYQSGNIGLFLNQGNGSLSNQTIAGTVQQPSSIVSADINKDGKQDIIAANVGGDINIFLGNGNGTFTNGTTITSVSASYIATADFNSDGKPDIASITNTYNVSIFLGNGNGTFTDGGTFSIGSYSFAITTADFNGDGKQDIAAANFLSNNVSVLLNHGNGTFANAVNYPVGNAPQLIATADFNDDGKPDIVTGGNGNNVSVLINHGNGTFANSTNISVRSYILTTADYNGDGKQDIASGGLYTPVVILTGNGAGDFTNAHSFPVGGQAAFAAKSADLNGDGKPDLVIMNPDDDNFSVLINNSSPCLPPVITDCAPARSASADANCSATVPDFTGNITATDNCTATAALIITQSPAAGTFVSTGSTQVTITVTDDAGKSATCKTTFTVTDNASPKIISCAPAQSAFADANCSATVPDFTGNVTVTDNCTGTAALTITQSPAAGTSVSTGTTQVTITVTDDAGKSATCKTTFTVTDNARPEITSCTPAQSAFADASCSATVPDFTGNVTATDNCTATNELIITQSPEAGTSVSAGTTPVTITVKDASGNYATCPAAFVVIDNIAPTINCSANIALSAGESTATWASPTAADNCSGVTVKQIAGPASGSTFAGGTTTTITYTATDGSNNVTSCSFTVTRPGAIGINIAKTDANCSGQSNGSITVTASGGKSPYQYKINTCASYQGGSTFSKLAPGNYTITVKDANNSTNSVGVVIGSIVTITATITAEKILCNGSKTTLTTAVTGGKAACQYKLINASSGKTIVNYQSNKKFLVSAGTYKVSIKDHGGCEATSNTINISQPSVLNIAKTSQANVTCKGGADGKIIVKASGGKSPYQYKINTRNSWQTSGTFQGLCAASYSIAVKDANGCTKSISISITQPSKGCTKAIQVDEIMASRGSESLIEDAVNELEVKVSPNPSNAYFTLITHGSNEKALEVRVLDMYGRIVYITKGAANETYRFGERFTDGTYIIQVIQEQLIKTVKVIKGY